MADKSTCHCNLVCFFGVDEKGHVKLWETIQFWRFVFACRLWGKTLNGHVFYQARGPKGAFSERGRTLFIIAKRWYTYSHPIPSAHRFLRLYLVFTYYSETAIQIRPRAFVSANFSVVLSILCGI